MSLALEKACKVLGLRLTDDQQRGWLPRRSLNSPNGGIRDAEVLAAAVKEFQSGTSTV